MKLKVMLVGMTASISLLAAVTVAAKNDYSKIRKDVSVMAGIIKGAFQDNDACKGCRIKVETTYLAQQGAVFTIKTYAVRGFAIAGSHDGHGSFYDLRSLQSLEHIPEIVNSILVEVDDSLDDITARIEVVEEFDGADFSRRHVYIDRSSVRELGRKTRDLEFQMRDYEIELLHAEDEADRKRLEDSIRSLEKDIEALAVRREGVNRKYETARKERDAERQAQRAERARKRTQKLVRTQEVIMQTFCDYGSTLRNLPNDEYVSVVFERKDDSSSIFVLNKDQVANCKSDGNGLMKKALTYQF